MTVRTITEQNYPQVATIYSQGIDTGIATFETTVPDWVAWDSAHLPHSRLALYESGDMVAWAALTKVSGRCVYSGVAEVSIYVNALWRGRGYGEILLNHLILESETHGIWTLQSGIFEENIASQRLHEKCGFRKIGYRERVAMLGGAWKNNVLLERRSKIVGFNQPTSIK